MALVFPSAPAVGQRFPVDPGTSGVSQWQWTGTQWNAVLSTVSLGTTNQAAFNNYTWPLADGAANKQLTTDGSGALSWADPATPSLQILSLLELFDGTLKNFTLVEAGSSTPFSPSPSTNIVVFLGGVPQIPAAAYTVATNTISFTEAPLVGTTFYAISSVNA